MTQRFRPSEQDAKNETGQQEPAQGAQAGQSAVEPTDADARTAAARERLRELRKAPASEKPAEPLRPKPTWMNPTATFETSEPPSRAELLARYRRQRGLAEERVGEGGSPAPAPARHERITAHPRPAARLAERLKAAEDLQAGQPRAGLSLPQTLAVAITVALATGVGVGLVSARFFASSGAAPQLVAVDATADAPGIASLPPLPKTPDPRGPAPQASVITKKTVPIATLQVADVTGETNSYIPLALHAEPAGRGGDIVLKISGLPDGAYLTSGRKEEDKIWALSLSESRDVKLVVPEARQPQFDLAVAAFEPKTGELAAPVKTMTVALSNATIEPASAPPPQQVSVPQAKAALAPLPAVPAPIPPPESTDLTSQVTGTLPGTHQLVLDGDEALRNGNIKAARSAYEKAWSKGVADGAFGLGRSYDPVVLKSLDLDASKPDKARAIAWYERAASAGHADAAAAIVRLRLKP